MHERNIYKTPPNFEQLAKKHSFLAPFVTLNSQGSPKLNFRDQAALRALTKALLLQDFQLDVDIPEDVLVPTVPLRLNYILWLEDLLAYNSGIIKNGEEICGIDVGTGATAIYALLAAKKNKWKMSGSEIDPMSVMLARANVKRNNLENLVQVRQVKESVLGEILVDTSPVQFHFTMCNPPFFESEDDTDSLSKARKEDRPEPSGAKTGTKSELIVSGGEMEFVSKMIEDSKKYAQSVQIFTTMIGIKRHVKDLVSRLKGLDEVKSVVSTEFTQGKTMRWGIAWSFNPQVHLSPPEQVSHTFENLPGCLNFENYIFSHLQSLNFHLLEWIAGSGMSFEVSPSQSLHFVATDNTWTGQRRKRREMERLKKLQGKSGEPPSKMLKVDGARQRSIDSIHGWRIPAPTMECNDADATLIDSQVEIVRNGPRATLNMSLLGGSLGKDGLNQIMTFLRNGYNRDAQNPKTELYQLLNSG